MQRKKISIFSAALVFLCLCSNAQSTPQELAKTVFAVFQTADTASLDTLTPKPSHIIGIFRQKYPAMVVDSASLVKKYVYHDQGFKKKCREMMIENSEINIIWKDARFIKSEFYERPYPYQDTAVAVSRRIMQNFLDVYFTSNAGELVLQFKEIYHDGSMWKLGEHVRLKKP